MRDEHGAMRSSWIEVSKVVGARSGNASVMKDGSSSGSKKQLMMIVLVLMNNLVAKRHLSACALTQSANDMSRPFTSCAS